MGHHCHVSIFIVTDDFCSSTPDVPKGQFSTTSLVTSELSLSDISEDSRGSTNLTRKRPRSTSLSPPTDVDEEYNPDDSFMQFDNDKEDDRTFDEVVSIPFHEL